MPLCGQMDSVGRLAESWRAPLLSVENEKRAFEGHPFQFLTRGKHSQPIVPAALWLYDKTDIVDVIILLQRLHQRDMMILPAQSHLHKFHIWIILPQPSDSFRRDHVHGRGRLRPSCFKALIDYCTPPSASAFCSLFCALMGRRCGAATGDRVEVVHGSDRRVSAARAKKRGCARILAFSRVFDEDVATGKYSSTIALFFWKRGSTFLDCLLFGPVTTTVLAFQSSEPRYNGGGEDGATAEFLYRRAVGGIAVQQPNHVEDPHSSRIVFSLPIFLRRSRRRQKAAQGRRRGTPEAAVRATTLFFPVVRRFPIRGRSHSVGPPAPHETGPGQRHLQFRGGPAGGAVLEIQCAKARCDPRSRISRRAALAGARHAPTGHRRRHDPGGSGGLCAGGSGEE